MSERILLAVILSAALYLFWTQKLRSDLTSVLVLLSLVMGPSQYRFRHYLQIGAVPAAVTWLVATLLIPLFYLLDRTAARTR